MENEAKERIKSNLYQEFKKNFFSFGLGWKSIDAYKISTSENIGTFINLIQDQEHLSDNDLDNLDTMKHALIMQFQENAAPSGRLGWKAINSGELVTSKSALMFAKLVGVTKNKSTSDEGYIDKMISEMSRQHNKYSTGGLWGNEILSRQQVASQALKAKIKLSSIEK